MVGAEKEEFERLADLCKDLSLSITKAEYEENADLSIELKKEYHEAKLKMIDMVQSNKDIDATISAAELKRDVDARPKVPRYGTGIEPLDNALKGGIEVGTFLQLAGESFAGKTHLVLEILSNIAEYKETMFFNFEMGDTRISQRLTKLFTKKEQWDNFKINSKARKLHDIVTEIKRKARNGVKFFAIDSKMKIEVSGDMDDYRSLNEISKQLAKLAQQEEIIILLINQMNEEDQKTGRLAFKGSGDQMYDTDIALFYMVNKDKETPPEKWKRTLVCRKNRQDEINFRIDLKLDATGRTVDANEIYPVHETTYQMPAI